MADWSVEVASRISGGLVSASGVPVHGWDTVVKATRGVGLGTAHGMKGAVFGAKNKHGNQVGRGWSGMKAGFRAGLNRGRPAFNRSLMDIGHQLRGGFGRR